MESLIVVQPPPIWSEGSTIRTVLADHQVAVFVQAAKVRDVCRDLNTRIVYSGHYIVRDMAMEIHKAVGHGKVLRVKKLLSTRRHTEMLWGFVQAVWESGVEVVILIDPVAGTIAERFHGTGRRFNFYPGEVVQIVKAGNVTKL